MSNAAVLSPELQATGSNISHILQPKFHQNAKNLVFRAFYATCCGDLNGKVPYLVDILIDRMAGIRVKRRHILMMEH
jgi:hypothetical protein